MYPSVRSTPTGLPTHSEETGKRRGGRGVLSRNLVVLGLTSFFTDISSEMVLAVAPLFLTTSLGFTILGFGLFEGAYQATSAIFRIWGGTVADRQQRHKATATTGYAISAATRIGLILSTIAPIGAVPFLLADRVGKGLRSAPRDALISLSTPPERIATAFGIHRTMDTAGALLGPLVAFAVLTVAPGSFDAVFVVSAIAALIGVLAIWLFAEERTTPRPKHEREPLWSSWRQVALTGGVPRLAVGVAALSALTVGDAFLYLAVQRSTAMSVRFFPLLFVGTALAYLVLAVPFGRLADAVGRRKVFLGGHLFLLAVYVLLSAVEVTTVTIVVAIGLLGGYWAATDGIIPALASTLVAPEVRATGIAFITVVIAMARVVATVVFGVAWTRLGMQPALAGFAVVLAVTLVFVWSTWRRSFEMDVPRDVLA